MKQCIAANIRVATDIIATSSFLRRTGDDTKVHQEPHCAITPEQIADTARCGRQAGAASGTFQCG